MKNIKLDERLYLGCHDWNGKKLYNGDWIKLLRPKNEMLWPFESKDCRIKAGDIGEIFYAPTSFAIALKSGEFVTLDEFMPDSQADKDTPRFCVLKVKSNTK